jgi:hypothetical protein
MQRVVFNLGWIAGVLSVAACGRVGFDSTRSDAGAGGADTRTPAAQGYLVEVLARQSGAMGGLAGADARCLTELTTNAWVGKAAASAAGQLVSSNVWAWLCTQASCRAFVPGDSYQYASTVATTRGGALFVATAEGYLPDDDHSFQDVDVFGPDDPNVHEYLTGRTQANLPQTTTCNDWMALTGQTNVAVNDTTFYAERLSKYPKPCSDSPIWMICVVGR